MEQKTDNKPLLERRQDGLYFNGKSVMLFGLDKIASGHELLREAKKWQGLDSIALVVFEQMSELIVDIFGKDTVILFPKVTEKEAGLNYIQGLYYSKDAKKL